MIQAASTGARSVRSQLKRIALCFDYDILGGFMTEWMLRKQQLRSGEITKEEYQEWKLNGPQTADDYGRFWLKKEWRKNK